MAKTIRCNPVSTVHISMKSLFILAVGDAGADLLHSREKAERAWLLFSKYLQQHGYTIDNN